MLTSTAPRWGSAKAQEPPSLPAVLLGHEARACPRASTRHTVAVVRHAGSHARVVTKSPGDCWQVGLIKILFPKARFVYCNRHPIDSCLSCYMQCFTRILFSTDLPTLAEVYRLYRRVMDHWRSVLPPGSIFDCAYEAMVADPDPRVRGLHEHCGLPFNESWAQFHDHARRVDTASQWQVRRPIYQTSVQRWKNYARFLGPLLDLVED